jgi:uncharacterized protein (DUF1501 family)
VKLPTASAFVREGVLVVGGAVIGALIIGAFPTLRDWINRQWNR